ncbi:MAG: hypothetical protein ACI865_000706 [Flavobacteriaceae bacterium]
MSGKPTTQSIGLIENTDSELGGDIEDDYLTGYKDLNSAWIPIYHRLDLTVLHTVKPKGESAKWVLSVGASFLNVYYQTNFLSRTYQLEYQEDDLGVESAETVTVDRYYLKFTPNSLVRFLFN